MNQYVYLFTAIAAEVIATSSLKSSAVFTKLIPSLVSISGYVVAFYFLSLALRTMPTAIAYAIWSGIGVGGIAIVAWLFQGQKLDAPAMIGILFIVLGVIIIYGLSDTVAQ
ncbi:multidrug transporter [Sphingobium sp. TomMM35A]